MQNILIAGATGYLGKYNIREAKKQGHRVRALARKVGKLDDMKEYIDETVEAEVTEPESLNGICDGVDIVISSIGITRQRDGLSYMDVDYRGNKNLLDEALKSKVKKFIYVSVLNAHLMKDLDVIKAKERFVEDLKASGIEYTVVRPTGFFSDMLEFVEMAKKGRVFLFGDGLNEINPIHGSDLAEVCVDSIYEREKDIIIGGPKVYTYKEIAELAFDVLNKPRKISVLPKWMIRFIMPVIRAFTPSKTYGPLEFMVSVMTMDVIGFLYGKERLETIFAQESAH